MSFSLIRRAHCVHLVTFILVWNELDLGLTETELKGD
ncbi:hypothetical protein VCR6J2_580093 [Vibrio coralliirubri]|nr:hypothetical protein VCR6J2_580093 [Vibrio coralliirubri]